MRSHHTTSKTTKKSGKSAKQIYYFVTTMDGDPVLNEDGTIMQFISTAAVRQGAKDRTFKSGQRHHSWGVPKDRRFKIKKIRSQTGIIPLGLAG